MFDSVKFLLDRIGIRMTSEGVRIAAMRELRNAYAESMGDPNSEVMSLIVPYVLGNGYTPLRKQRKYVGNIDPNRRGRTLSHTKAKLKSKRLSNTPEAPFRDPQVKLYALRESRVSLGIGK